jgi:hypothetical protein
MTDYTFWPFKALAQQIGNIIPADLAANVAERIVVGGTGVATTSRMLAADVVPAEHRTQRMLHRASNAAKQDLGKAVNDPRYAQNLPAEHLEFLKVAAGIDPPAKAKGWRGTPVAPLSNPKTPEQKAVAQMRTLIQSGELQAYFDAAIGHNGGANKVSQADALALFNALPSFNPATVEPKDLVAAGLWTTGPKNWDAMNNSPRYFKGRQVFVQTTVTLEHNYTRDASGAFTKESNEGAFLTFKPGGQQMVTHKATIAGEKGDNFLVDVQAAAGGVHQIEVPKSEIYRLNQPDSDQSQVAPTDPLAKAKFAEAAILMDPLVSVLDFSKDKTEPQPGLLAHYRGSNKSAVNMVDVAAACFTVAYDVLDIIDARDSLANQSDRRSSGAQAFVRGAGYCGQQAQYYKNFFTLGMGRLLGFDIQMHSCQTWTDFMNGGYNRTPQGQPARLGGGHAHLVAISRPFGAVYVCDGTWNEPLLHINMSNSLVGEHYYGRSGQSVAAKPTDVDTSDAAARGSVFEAFTKRPAGRALGRNMTHGSVKTGNLEV